VSLLDTMLLPLERVAIAIGARWEKSSRLRGAVARQWRRTITSPMEWLSVYALILGGLGVFLLDEPLALLFKETVSGDFEGFLKIVTELGIAGVWLIPTGILTLVFLLARRVAVSPAARERFTRLAWAPGFVFLSMAVAGLIGDLLKFLVGRSRPQILFEQGIATFTPFSHGWAVNSFPSGHSQAIFSAMIALALVFPRYSLAYIALAILVASSRVLTTVHYFSDVVAGAWLGIFITLALAKLLSLRGIDVRYRKPGEGGW